MEFEQLTDDALVAVMQLLSVPDVLACRLVCKRLCDLASHWDVWRHLVLAKDDTRWLCPTLRLAPCLKKMQLRLPRDSCNALYTTRCAVAELELEVDGLGEFGCGSEATLAIRNQNALGRLKRVEVSFRETFSSFGVSVILGVLAATSGLRELKVHAVHAVRDDYYRRNSPAFHSPVSIASSLTRFECNPSFENFCNVMITGHRATLAEIVLYFPSYVRYNLMPRASFVALIAGLPNLKRLECPLLSGLSALADCASLRSLTLHITTCPQYRLREAAEYLRRATQLRQLRLHPWQESISPPLEHGVELLVQSLASSGRSSLEDLTIAAITQDVGSIALYDDEDPQDPDYLCEINFEKLLGALPSLPALRRLEVDGQPDKLLPGLTQVTAPGLRSVVLNVDRPPMDCFHAWVHSDEVRSALTLHPLLHVKLHFTAYPESFNSSDCYCTSTLCRDCPVLWHEQLRMFANVGVFSHPEDKKCPVDHNKHNKADDSIWAHVPL